VNRADSNSKESGVLNQLLNFRFFFYLFVEKVREVMIANTMLRIFDIREGYDFVNLKLIFNQI
jgi:hypothetical protein